MKHVSRYGLGLLLAVALNGCGPGSISPDGNVGPQAQGTPDVAATVQAGVEATVAAQGQGAGAATTKPAATSKPAATDQPVAATTPASGEQFKLEGRATSSQLNELVLETRSATIGDDALVVRIAFVNTSDEGFTVVGGTRLDDTVLVDAGGDEYKPTDVDDTFRNGIDPEGGFTPGAANVGNLSFPLPTGRQPYELRLPGFEPLAITLDTPLTEAAALALGSYPIDGSVRSTKDALRPVELQVRTITVTAERLLAEVAFVNTGREGYDLLIGPTGKDARLLDGEGTQYEPLATSPSLQKKIAPEGGWAPAQANVGVLEFPLPADTSELRLLFPSYDALSMRFDAGGLQEASVTSPSGGAPAPTPTPGAEELALADIEQLLAKQAEALRNGDVDGYLATLDPALRDEQRAIAERVAGLPVVSMTITLAPGTTADDDTLNDVPVDLTFALKGVAPQNLFVHQLRYDFGRSGQDWQVQAIKADENPPFWLGGDLVVQETPHFLIIARPEAEGELAALEQETEQAYQSLQAEGLPLEEKYVAYFTAEQDDFAQLTGANSERYLGMALSRYTFEGDEIVVRSRAFYINGASFADPALQGAGNDRQTTITHELTHLALSDSTRPFSPIWLVEGAAVFFSEQNREAQEGLLVTNDQLEQQSLPELTGAGKLGEHDFSGEQTSYQYVYSGAAFAYMVETFGEQQTLDFYRSFATVPAAQVREKMPRFGGAFLTEAAFGELSKSLTEQKLQEQFGKSIEQLDGEVKEWLRQRAG